MLNSKALVTSLSHCTSEEFKPFPSSFVTMLEFTHSKSGIKKFGAFAIKTTEKCFLRQEPKCLNTK